MVRYNVVVPVLPAMGFISSFLSLLSTLSFFPSVRPARR
jgi:hypothetical protein